MKIKKISTGDYLYHPVHGMCRIDRLIQRNQSGKKELSYSLVPKIMRELKVRFVIAADQIEASGFHDLLTTEEANRILDYLKAGDGSAPQTHQTWLLAQNILNFSFGKFPPQEQKKRQTLEYSAKGLVGELACVFDISLKEAAEIIKKSLGKIPKSNQSVLAVLTRAGED